MTECWQMTERHHKVNEVIELLMSDKRCKGSAMGKLVNLVDEKLLQVDPEARFHGGRLYQKIHEILEECKRSKRPLQLVNKGPVPKLDERDEIFTEPPKWSQSQTTTAESKASSSSNSTWKGHKS